MISELPQRIKAGGRIVLLTFQSLEDRFVKRGTIELENKIIDNLIFNQ